MQVGSACLMTITFLVCFQMVLPQTARLGGVSFLQKEGKGATEHMYKTKKRHANWREDKLHRLCQAYPPTALCTHHVPLLWLCHQVYKIGGGFKWCHQRCLRELTNNTSIWELGSPVRCHHTNQPSAFAFSISFLHPCPTFAGL